MPERISFHDQIRRNKMKSFFLIVIIFVFFILLGWIIALAVNPGYFFFIMIFAIIFSLLYVLISYYNSDKIALASVGAKKANREEHAKFYHAAENMAIASGYKRPGLYVMESEQINAFASGRNPEKAVICVTTGCLRKLEKHELEGVIAHEMSHIANYDIRFMTLVAVMVGLISITAQIFLRSLWFSSGRDRKGNAWIMIIAVVAAILAPLVAHLVSLAISRKREFSADATAVKFTRYPVGLKKALEKIRHEHLEDKDKKRYPQAMASLFISDPFKSKIKGLFSTHPPIDVRIAKLEKM
ncbi:MAG: M48 family metallopeptidase [Nanoarchaeota archaeon]|nr:M48 family metallopeptidase [Nanoarchaeota archaeon]MBU1051025.1 M48 family metallopeptidase [Nanoarchaeota archaeon]MBU1988498.1 M48 family metallopeptidase [Nanoarchaeota archaeon]